MTRPVASLTLRLHRLLGRICYDSAASFCHVAGALSVTTQPCVCLTGALRVITQLRVSVTGALRVVTHPSVSLTGALTSGEVTQTLSVTTWPCVFAQAHSVQ